jgi:hypothetical protein
MPRGRRGEDWKIGFGIGIVDESGTESGPGAASLAGITYS